MEKEVHIKVGDKNIYGKLYTPSGKGKKPLVILSHGFGGSYTNVKDYAINFAKNGIASFAFDFVGGGYGSRSGGSMTEMSVLTEADDLNLVLDHFRKESTIDRKQIFLFGESQGGFVSTYVAGNRPEDVAGLVLLYPAFVLQDDSRERNPDPQSGPDESSVMGMRIGKIYDVDAQSFDIYDVMKKYTGKTLIIHGTDDSIVPLEYSERAAKTIPDAQLKTIGGADHGFYGSAEKKASKWSLDFIKSLNTIS